MLLSYNLLKTSELFLLNFGAAKLKKNGKMRHFLVKKAMWKKFFL